MKFSRYIKLASRRFEQYIDGAIAEHLDDLYEYVDCFKGDYFDGDLACEKLLDSMAEMLYETEFYNPRKGDTLDKDTMKLMLRTAVNVHVSNDYEALESRDTSDWERIESEYEAAASRIIEVL